MSEGVKQRGTGEGGGQRGWVKGGKWGQRVFALAFRVPTTCGHKKFGSDK